MYPKSQLAKSEGSARNLKKKRGQWGQAADTKQQMAQELTVSLEFLSNHLVCKLRHFWPTVMSLGTETLVTSSSMTSFFYFLTSGFWDSMK